MKFKSIFIVFNVVIIASFLFIFLAPFFMLGGDFSRELWQQNWYLLLILFVVLLILNAVYFANRVLLGHIEKEDWPATKTYLEKELFEKKKIRKSYLRLYINACIVTNSINDIARLDEHLRQEKPALREHIALYLGFPALVESDSRRMAQVYHEFLDLSGEDGLWIQWLYAFAQMLERREEVMDRLITLAENPGAVKNRILFLMTLYLMDPFSDRSEKASALIAEGRRRLLNELPEKGLWDKEIEKKKDQIQVILLLKMVREALDWLYKTDQEG